MTTNDYDRFNQEYFESAFATIEFFIDDEMVHAENGFEVIDDESGLYAIIFDLRVGVKKISDDKGGVYRADLAGKSLKAWRRYVLDKRADELLTRMSEIERIASEARAELESIATDMVRGGYGSFGVGDILVDVEHADPVTFAVTSLHYQPSCGPRGFCYVGLRLRADGSDGEMEHRAMESAVLLESDYKTRQDSELPF